MWRQGSGTKCCKLFLVPPLFMRVFRSEDETPAQRSALYIIEGGSQPRLPMLSRLIWEPPCTFASFSFFFRPPLHPPPSLLPVKLLRRLGAVAFLQPGMKYLQFSAILRRKNKTGGTPPLDLRARFGGSRGNFSQLLTAFPNVSDD